MIRDNALDASGLISTRMGGGGSKPYDLTESFKPMGHDKGEGLYRRSVYTFWKRTGPAPVMMALDAGQARRLPGQARKLPPRRCRRWCCSTARSSSRRRGRSASAMVREHGDNIGAMVHATRSAR